MANHDTVYRYIKLLKLINKYKHGDYKKYRSMPESRLITLTIKQFVNLKDTKIGKDHFKSK